MDAPHIASDFRFSGQTDIGKLLDQFDTLPIASQLEKFLSADPACIKLFQLLVKRHGYIFNEEVIEYFNKEYMSSSIPSFIIQRKCKHCNLDVEYVSLADSDFNKTKSRSTSSCTKCRSSIHIKETKHKKFQTADILSIFKYGMRCGIFRPFQYSSCLFCKNEEPIDAKEAENHISTTCRNCGEPVEIKVSFELDKTILDKFDIVNSQGYWFEWYLGHIIKSKMKDRIVKRNQIYRIGKREIELDLLVEKNGMITCVSCSAEKDGEFDSVNFHLIKKVCNKLVLACPDNNIPTQIVESAKSTFNENVSTITLTNFCDIDSLTKIV